MGKFGIIWNRHHRKGWNILVFENTKLHGTKSKVQAVPLGFLVIPAPCESRVSKHLLGLRTMVSQQMEMQTTPKNTSYLRVFGDMGVPMCIHTSIPLYVYSIQHWLHHKWSGNHKQPTISSNAPCVKYVSTFTHTYPKNDTINAGKYTIHSA